MSNPKGAQAPQHGWHPDDWKRRIALREYRRGKQDGRLGFSVSGLSEAYLEGYVVGRKIHHGLLRG